MAELKRVEVPEPDDETFHLISNEEGARLCGPGPGRPLSALYQAIVNTVHPAHRVVVYLRPSRMKALRSSVRDLAKRHGLQGHCRRTMDGAGLVVWLERPAPAPAAEETP